MVDWLRDEQLNMSGKMSKEEFRMPDFTITTNVNKYVKAWKKLAKPICDATGAQLHAFDPTVQIFYGQNLFFGRVIDLPPTFLMKLNKALLTNKAIVV